MHLEKLIVLEYKSALIKEVRKRPWPDSYTIKESAVKITYNSPLQQGRNRLGEAVMGNQSKAANAGGNCKSLLGKYTSLTFPYFSNRWRTSSGLQQVDGNYNLINSQFSFGYST